MALSPKQRGVVRGITAAAAITVAGFAAARVWAPAFLIPADDLPSRIAFALRIDLAIVVCLVLTIGALARHRFFTPADIDGGGLVAGTDRAKALQAILQNTLEQSVLAVLVHLVWAVSAPLPWLSLIAAATVLFVVGRVLFWRGYGHGAAGRALGFGLTFYPSVLLVFAAIPIMLF